MKDPMTSQTAPLPDPAEVTLASLEMALMEREREIDLLRREVDRHKRQSEEAEGRAAMIQAAFDRHFAHCSRDDGEIQRLMAGLAEATARRKEQAAIIERRDRLIIALQEELDKVRPRGSINGIAPPKILGLKILALRLKRAFSLRRA
jgi:chromosome segregation ATPase